MKFEMQNVTAATKRELKILLSAWPKSAVAVAVFLQIVLFSIKDDYSPAVLPMVRWGIIIFAGLLLLKTGGNALRNMAAPILFCTYMGISLVIGPNFKDMLPIYLRIVGMLMIGLCLRPRLNFEKINFVHVLMSAFGAVTLASLITGLLNVGDAYVGSESAADGRYRLQGITWHPGILGYAACMSAVWNLTELRSSLNGTFKRFWALCMIGVSITCLYMSDSRTGYIAIVLAALMLYLSKYFEIWARHHYEQYILKFVIPALIVVGYSIPIYVALVNFSELTVTDGTSALRTQAWIWGIRQFVDHPLMGAGMGAYASVRIGAYTEDLMYLHSAMINHIAHGGVMGLSAFLFLQYSLYKSVFLRAASSNYGSFSYRICSDRIYSFKIIAFVVTLVYSVTEGALQGVYTSFVVAFSIVALDLRPPKSGYENNQ
ncbi:hypothetical protein GTZ99_13945 [Novosphingobium sp. FSY-8]|uniref:O-antigen ligase-related domain-containing protein n=2 Tax=Novosphingobium ovatum TaxID=1908523 RepID=A0ABW9XGJ6_9SPHN|nr:O-antigen ligase family protein [Novosphingobium ovatum]NBC37653.1 hypothetical protein [Novosphingobium ovatum]